MQLNEAVSKRITELLTERNMTNYQLYVKSGVPKSTIGNLVNCTYDSVKLRVQGNTLPCHLDQGFHRTRSSEFARRGRQR